MDNIGHAIDFCFCNHGGVLFHRNSGITPIYINYGGGGFTGRSTAYPLFFVSYYLGGRTVHRHTPDTGNIQAGSGFVSLLAAEAAAYRR